MLLRSMATSIDQRILTSIDGDHGHLDRRRQRLEHGRAWHTIWHRSRETWIHEDHERLTSDRRLVQHIWK